MFRHILIRKTGAAYGGDLRAYTSKEVADLYPSDQLARLALGQPVQVGDCTHVDLMAFYLAHAAPSAQAAPQSRGSVFLRNLLRRPLAPQLGEAA